MLHVTEVHPPMWRVMLARSRPRWLWITFGFGLGAIVGRFLV